MRAKATNKNSTEFRENPYLTMNQIKRYSNDC